MFVHAHAHTHTQTTQWNRSHTHTHTHVHIQMYVGRDFVTAMLPGHVRPPKARSQLAGVALHVALTSARYNSRTLDIQMSSRALKTTLRQTVVLRRGNVACKSPNHTGQNRQSPPSHKTRTAIQKEVCFEEAFVTTASSVHA